MSKRIMLLLSAFAVAAICRQARAQDAPAPPSDAYRTVAPTEQPPEGVPIPTPSAPSPATGETPVQVAPPDPAMQPAPPMIRSSGPATNPAGPTTRPTSAPALPDEFAVFKTRNAFAHGKAPVGPGGAGGPKGPEAALIFRGAVESTDHFTAFVEDTNSKRFMELAAGATLARGTIKSIDLDGLVYESAGKSKRIEVGQNLDGQVVPPTPTSKPAGPQAPPGGPPGAPGQPMPGQPGMPPGAGPPGRGVRTAPVANQGK